MVLASELLVHAVEESYLTTADTYITGRDILVGTDATPELEHEGLAETHDLRVGFADGVKVRTTLCTAHRKGRKGILERLLETEELQHGRRHGTVETQSAFVRTNSRIELNTVTEVRLHFALVIDPSDTESEDTVGLDHTLYDLRLLKFGMLVIHLFD